MKFCIIITVKKGKVEKGREIHNNTTVEKK